MQIYDNDIGGLSDALENNLGHVLGKMFNDITEVSVEGNIYFDQRPVYRIHLKSGGERKTAYAKSDWEGNGKESYGIAFHNLVSASKINFASFNKGRIIFTEEVAGKPLKDHKALVGNLAKSYGEAVAVAEFVGIGDRYANNILNDEESIRHIDFGSFFTGGMPMYKWETSDVKSEKDGYSNAMRRIEIITKEESHKFEELLSGLSKISPPSHRSMRENYEFMKNIDESELEKLLP